MSGDVALNRKEQTQKKACNFPNKKQSYATEADELTEKETNVQVDHAAAAAALFLLLDRLMWMCHTGRAAAPHTKAAPRRHQNKHKKKQKQEKKST
ncbi:hypothetical protein OUZ56_013637 [Daphnia magna]|uniref:Uncharacterized protein n=1 Tax=Daphnia magna TaxID=35525 RepID=A0ABQ9Z6J4_9CRUS|nr:hypothetical protein OUZ56_013637 [Daphnia magna]